MPPGGRGRCERRQDPRRSLLPTGNTTRPRARPGRSRVPLGPGEIHRPGRQLSQATTSSPTPSSARRRRHHRRRGHGHGAGPAGPCWRRRRPRRGVQRPRMGMRQRRLTRALAVALVSDPSVKTPSDRPRGVAGGRCQQHDRAGRCCGLRRRRHDARPAGQRHARSRRRRARSSCCRGKRVASRRQARVLARRAGGNTVWRSGRVAAAGSAYRKRPRSGDAIVA